MTRGAGRPGLRSRAVRLGAQVAIIALAATAALSGCRDSGDNDPEHPGGCPPTEQEAAFVTTELVSRPTTGGLFGDRGSDQLLKVTFQCVPVGAEGRCAPDRVLVVLDAARRVCDDRGAVERLQGQAPPTSQR